MKDKATIFKINQVMKKSNFSVSKIAEVAGMTESQLRTYMNTRVPPLEQYSTLVEAFTKLGETDLAEQLLLQFTGLGWCFYFHEKTNGAELDPNKTLRALSILQGKINNIFENLEDLDQYKKMHALIHIQNMISLAHDLIRLIDRENRFLRLWS